MYQTKIMKRLGYFFAILFVLSGATVFGQKDTEKTLDMKAYKIVFPTAPQKTEQTVESKIGPIKMHIWLCQPNENEGDNNYAYNLIESDYPDSLINSAKTEVHDIFFRGAIDGAVKNVNGILLNEVSEIVGKYPSRAIEVDYGKGQAIIKMKLVLRENKLIIVQTITETAKYPNASITEFFGSFVVK